MSLINCESILFKFVWTASGKPADVCFHSYCQVWHGPKWLPGNMVAIQWFFCSNQIMISLPFVRLWRGPTATAASSRPHRDSHKNKKKRSIPESVREWGRGRSEIRPKVQGNDQEPEPAGQIWTKKERKDPASARLSVGALGAKWRYFSLGMPCDLLLCLLFSHGGWKWEKWLWDSVFPVQETSSAFLGGLLVHAGGGPP